MTVTVVIKLAELLKYNNACVHILDVLKIFVN